MFPPNSTIRRVDIFQTADHRATVVDVSRQVYNESGGCDNRSILCSYEREGSFLNTVRYFREHGYKHITGTLRGPSRSVTGHATVSMQRITVPDFPMPFVPAKYTILDDSEMPF